MITDVSNDLLADPSAQNARPGSSCNAAKVGIRHKKEAVHLFESNQRSKYTRRSIQETVKRYAQKTIITRRIHSHLFRHHLLTYLTGNIGIVEPMSSLSGGTSNMGLLGLKDK
jgi:integrase